MPEKITGYTLLVIGLLVIVFAGINVWQVFTGKTEPIGLFNFPPVTLDLSGSVPGGAEAGIKPVEVASSDMINKTLNIFVNLFLMGFIASIGYKLASLGIMLIRPIVVKLRETQEKPHPTPDPKAV